MEETLGQIEHCPESACPFWETPDAGPKGQCVFAQLDLGGRPELAAFLLGIRRELSAAGAAASANDARRHFFRRLNAGRGD